LEFLCDDGWPLSGLWYAVAGILSADEENDWSDVGVEVVLDGVVSLFPGFDCFVVEVVEGLVEPELILGVDERVLGFADCFLIDLFGSFTKLQGEGD
jgi:hypothetical protein